MGVAVQGWRGKREEARRSSIRGGAERRLGLLTATPWVIVLQRASLETC